MTDSKNQYHILAVKRAVQLINLFAEHGPNLGVSEIAKLMNIHKSVVHKLLVTLESEDWVHKSKTTEKYSLGLKLLKLSPLVPNRNNFRQISRTIMSELVSEVDETAMLTIMTPSYDQGICIEKVECSHNIRMTTEIGNHIPIHAGASGLVLAAYTDEEKIESVLSQPLPAFTENTITNPDTLRKKLQEIRKQGYAFSISEVNQGLVGIASPVFNSRSKLVAGLSISGPVYRFEPTDKVDRMIELVKSSAQRITDNLIASDLDSIM